MLSGVPVQSPLLLIAIPASLKAGHHQHPKCRPDKHPQQETQPSAHTILPPRKKHRVARILLIYYIPARAVCFSLYDEMMLFCATGSSVTVR